MTAAPRPTGVWPSLAAVLGGEIPADELKVLLPEATARVLRAWATGHQDRVPHGEAITRSKLLNSMPPLFKGASEAQRRPPSALSQYRRCAAAVGPAGEEGHDP